MLYDPVYDQHVEGMMYREYIFFLLKELQIYCKIETMGVIGHMLYYRPWPEDAHSKVMHTVSTSSATPSLLGLLWIEWGVEGFLVGS